VSNGVKADAIQLRANSVIA